jgi:ketosteroid isomerase-like protein
MKKMIFLMLFLPLFVSRSFAQDAAENAVSGAVEALRKAMVDKDKATLGKLTADDLSYGHSGGQVQNKQEFIEALTDGRTDFVSIDLSAQTVKVVDGVAIVRHILSAVTNDGGKPGTVKLSVLMVWQRQQGEWKLLARQAVHVP